MDGTLGASSGRLAKVVSDKLNLAASLDAAAGAADGRAGPARRGRTGAGRPRRAFGRAFGRAWAVAAPSPMRPPHLSPPHRQAEFAAVLELYHGCQRERDVTCGRARRLAARIGRAPRAAKAAGPRANASARAGCRRSPRGRRATDVHPQRAAPLSPLATRASRASARTWRRSERRSARTAPAARPSSHQTPAQPVRKARTVDLHTQGRVAHGGQRGVKRTRESAACAAHAARHSHSNRGYDEIAVR